MDHKTTEANIPFCNMIESGDYNCYEFYLAATEKFGDYKQAQHMDQIIMRSEMIRDIEALATYFSEELGLTRGDAYTIFLPTDIESIVGFYALNKLGVIVNFVHPLLPTEVSVILLSSACPGTSSRISAAVFPSAVEVLK